MISLSGFIKQAHGGGGDPYLLIFYRGALTGLRLAHSSPKYPQL